MPRHSRASKADRFRVARRGSRRAAERPARCHAQVFICSDHPIYCDSLRSLLDGRSGLRIVGSTSQWTMAVDAARACRPDIILLDLHTPLVSKSSIVSALLAACGSARIIVLTPRLERREVSEALRLGIRGVVLKGVNAEVLFKSISAVAAGQYWIDREIFIGLVQTLSGDGTQNPTVSNHPRFGLTNRELEITAIVAGGGSNKEIARQCGISEKTVKHHLTNTFDKLGLSNRLELAVFALEHQLVRRDFGTPDQSAEAG